MDYAEAREAFFQPGAPDAPAAVPRRSPARALRDAIEPLATVCWWSEPSYDAYAALGLDFLEGYVYSRASTLGEADPAVAVAAFGVFEPGVVTTTLESARARASLEEIRAARLNGAVASLREVLGGPDPDGVAEVVDVLRRGLGAARPLGRALFAGAAGLGWPDDPLGALWHACVQLREYRGDGHLAACVAAGLDGVEANLLTELWVGWTLTEYTGSRAWPEAEMDAAVRRLRDRGLIDGETLSPAGRELRDGLEETTDATVATVIDAIGSDLGDVTARCEAWSQRIVDRGWFPPDPLKRAAG